MDKAKAAITDFMGRSGHHDTTVHEAVAPAVVQETIKPHVHEEVNTAIDKEVHQDHYHRTVQPVKDREVLPEKHEAKIGAVQHREFDHRDHESTKKNLVAEQAQFKDERRVDATSHSQSVAPVVGGEHVHHHIHETIQPVVQKETIQPSVVHTTVPIHEVHHNKATHHETTALPAMTMDQFKSKGGSLTGREERYDEFEGVPKNIGSTTAGGLGAVSGLSHKEGHHSHSHGTANPLDRNNDGRVDARDTGAMGQGNLAGSSTQGGVLGNNVHSGTSHTGAHHGTDGVIGGTRNESDRLAHRDHEDGAHKKPSLMDKLNPKVDADGDGKAGFMK
ncbi:hypothetical protein LEMA_P056020.1 [Plenodomus lingam JN3]|uniref:Allergen n=1 Tax=Leptosphaeria maculans (strain JN3 / isolate v23.1.3 / race Av1-4-5-6-7-8) TaxID=985895 RepID=E4ZMM7_LEPMJ|nr:hypothetical protein LEMA_P056020.1 [Plenodomus lingam JN3]CBX92896.1 hypothetical protein LEMA_P056020.1 [Plenodomus lingam JN3]